MPRLYFNPYVGFPFYSNEQGVGIGMLNARGDVMLIQYLLKAILHAGKEYQSVPFTRPSGSELAINGIWDETSKKYLEHWENRHVTWRFKNMRVAGTTLPGTIVPHSKGGKKIGWMNHYCVFFFGPKAYSELRLPNVTFPKELWKDVFIDFVIPPS